MIISAQFETSLKMYRNYEIFIAKIHIFNKKLVYSMSNYFKRIISAKYGLTEHRGLNR